MKSLLLAATAQGVGVVDTECVPLGVAAEAVVGANVGHAGAASSAHLRTNGALVVTVVGATAAVAGTGTTELVNFADAD